MRRDELSDRDITRVHRLLRADVEPVGVVGAADEGPTLPWQVMEDLVQLVRCDEVSLCELDHVVQTRLVQQVVHDEREHDVLHGEYEWEGGEDDTFFDYGRCVPRPAGVRRTSAEMTRQQRRNDPFLVECAPGLLDDVSVEFPAPPGISRRLMFRRFEDGPDFTERDTLVLEMLRLRLQELHRLTRRRRLLPLLTSRQWEVLSLIARGTPTAGIALTLFTSEATVRKHVENILGRLEVRSREAAVAAVMPVLGASVGPFPLPAERAR